MIEKARTLSELAHAINGTHGLVHDDIEDLSVGLQVLSLSKHHLVVVRPNENLTVNRDAEDVVLSENLDIEVKCLVQPLHGPDARTRVEELTKQSFELEHVPLDCLFDLVLRSDESVTTLVRVVNVSRDEADRVLEDRRQVVDLQSVVVCDHIGHLLSCFIFGHAQGNQRLGRFAREATASGPSIGRTIAVVLRSLVATMEVPVELLIFRSETTIVLLAVRSSILAIIAISILRFALVVAIPITAILMPGVFVVALFPFTLMVMGGLVARLAEVIVAGGLVWVSLLAEASHK